MKRNLLLSIGLTLTLGAACLAFDQEPPPSKPAAPVGPVAPQTPPNTPAAPTQFKPGEAPKLSVGAKEWDFGQKWYGEKCENEVTIKNEGNFDLTITNIRTSCGCTLAKPKSGGVWQNKVLKPGESDSMQLSYNTKKAATKVSQTVTIESNDPSTPSYQFMVKGEVRHICKMEPGDRITFPRIDKDKEASQGITLTSQTDKPLDLKLEALPENAKFKAELKTDEPGKKWTLTVSTKPPLEVGSNVIDVKIATGSTEMPTITVPVSSYVAPRVSVSPAKLFASAKVSTPIQRSIRVTYPPDKPIKITNVTCSSDKIKTEIIPPTAPTTPNAMMAFTEIKVNLPAGSEIANGAKIEIETDDPAPEYKKLTVEVVVRDENTPPAKPGVTPTPGATAKPGAAPAAGVSPTGSAGKPGAPTTPEKKDKP